MNPMTHVLADSASARIKRLRRIAARTENDCAEQGGRADLLLRAALHRQAVGDIDMARSQVEALIARADDDPEYAPVWLVQQARDLVALLDEPDKAQHSAD